MNYLKREISIEKFSSIEEDFVNFEDYYKFFKVYNKINSIDNWNFNNINKLIIFLNKNINVFDLEITFSKWNNKVEKIYNNLLNLKFVSKEEELKFKKFHSFYEEELFFLSLEPNIQKDYLIFKIKNSKDINQIKILNKALNSNILTLKQVFYNFCFNEQKEKHGKK